jgi:hypothetical protein
MRGIKKLLIGVTRLLVMEPKTTKILTKIKINNRNNKNKETQLAPKQLKQLKQLK